MQEQELMIIGTSDAVYAEYSYKARDGIYTLLIMCDGDPVSVEGFNSKADLLAVANEAKEYGTKVYQYFG